MPNIWDSLRIFMSLLRFWITSPALPSAKHIQLTFSAQINTTPVLLLFLVVFPWYWHLQNAAVFCSNLAALPPIAWALFIVWSLNFLQWSLQSSCLHHYSSCTFPSGLSCLSEPNLSCFPWPLYSIKPSITWESPTHYQIWLPAELYILTSSSISYLIVKLFSSFCLFF